MEDNGEKLKPKATLTPNAKGALAAGGGFVALDVLTHAGPTGLLVAGISTWVMARHTSDFLYMKDRLVAHFVHSPQLSESGQERTLEQRHSFGDRLLGRHLSEQKSEPSGQEASGSLLSRMLANQSPESDCLTLSETLSIHADEFLAERKLIVGVSGSGKSNSVAVICEELGELDVPFVLFDTENEYESLCDEKYLTCWCRLDSSNLSTDNAAQWAAYILDNNVQSVVNLQDFDMETAALIMVNMIEGLTAWQEERSNDQRIPCEIILEEATTWLPQNTSESQLDKATLSALQNTFFNDVVRKGRKRGLGFTAVCQKIAELDKRALQCRVKILHGQSELIDLKRYEAMGISSEETLSLKGGEAFVWVGRIAKKRVQMRLRRSPHGANTPTLVSLRKSRSVGESASRFRASTTAHLQAQKTTRLPETTRETEMEMQEEKAQEPNAATIAILREIGKRLGNGESPVEIRKSLGVNSGRAVQEINAALQILQEYTEDDPNAD